MNEQQQIEELINAYPKHCIAMIKRNLVLWAWVQMQTASENITDAARVYAAVSGTTSICANGNTKKLKSLAQGWAFCGRANVCACAKQSVSEKCKQSAATRDWAQTVAQRQKTNLAKYGHINAAQSLAIKKKHQEYYANPVNVAKTNAQYQLTVQQKYGVDNPAQLDFVKQKRKSTLLEKYGVDNPQKNEEVKLKSKKTKQLKYAATYQLEKSYEVMFEKFKKLGYTFLVSQLDYQGVNQTNTTKYKFCHDLCGREFETYIYSGNRPVCPTCFYKQPSFVSKAETELADWIESLNVTVVRTERKLITPLHIDIYLPDYQLAIEYCGLYWHSQNANGKTSDYHAKKTKLCAEQNIQLITIFEDEWVNKKELVKSIIQNRLGKSKKVGARKCQLIEVSGQQAKSFLEDNHLQGYSPASLNIALMLDNSIVSLMTFGKPRFSKNAQWELVRYCTRIGYSITGGSLKLWSYFTSKCLPLSVLSYCDLRWFTGTTYKKLGMTLVKTTTPGYWYTDYVKRWHRSNFTKARLVKQGHNNKLTEQQIMDQLNIDRIWDCGQAVYQINIINTITNIDE